MRRRLAAPLVRVAMVTLVAHGVARADGGAARDDADPQSARNPDYERYVLRAELGAEYDTNAHRTESLSNAMAPPTVSSPLARMVLTGWLSDAVSARQDVWVSATAAGKLFTLPDARSEDVAIAESGAFWRVRVATRAALALSGAYYEAFQRDDGGNANISERRDFRSLSGGLRLTLAPARTVELGVGAGARFFVFKPDRDFDFQAPTGGLDLRWSPEVADGAADWDVVVGALYERRAFAGPSLVSAGTTATMGAAMPDPSGRLRADDFLITRVEVARTGLVMVGAGYVLQYNASSSYGETAFRHFVTARFAAALPLDVFLTARAELLFAHYPDGTPVAQPDAAGRTFMSIEDENRSSVRADLSRNLGERLQLIARYTFYGPALSGTPVAYRRQTALLSLAFTFEK